MRTARNKVYDISMYFFDTKTLPTVGGTKTARPLIFLATIEVTFNRHLVDIARVVSLQSSAYIAFSPVRCVRECRPA